MKKLAAIIVVFGALFVASQAVASTQSIAPNGCPRSAGSLQEFAGCLAPVRGTVAAVYRGSQAAYLDDDHRELLGAMQQNPGVPPQVMPSYPIVQPYYYNSFGATMARASAYVAATQTGNPYYFMMMGMPMY